MQVLNVRYLPGRRNRTPDTDESPRDTAGSVLLVVTSALLLALAVAQGYVSYRARYSFVHAIKHERSASTLESLGLDCAAVTSALLAIAQARLGRPAVAERVLNLACVSGSLVMNALSADVASPKSVAVWVCPPRCTPPRPTGSLRWSADALSPPNKATRTRRGHHWPRSAGSSVAAPAGHGTA